MKLDIEKLIQKSARKGTSSSIIMIHKKLEEQLRFVQTFAKNLLHMEEQKAYRIHPDLFGIWEEDIQGKSISIEQIHEFIRKIQLRPFTASCKIGVIIQGEKMTVEAQNALLKTLEEPPANTFIIITVADSAKLLDTITSRCQIFHTRDKEEKRSSKELIKQLLSGTIIKRFKMVEKLLSEKDGQKKQNSIDNLLRELLLYYRKLLLSAPEESQKFIPIIDCIEMTKRAIEKNVSPRLAMENLMLQLPQNI